MAYLANPAHTVAVLEKHGIRAQKKYGQNFLIDPHVLEKIMDGAEISKNDLVIEIGPGIGTMTQYLAERAGQVIAVEIDEKLLPVLDDTLKDYDNVRVVNADILKTDIRKLTEEYGGYSGYKIVANLPYYITTPILMALLEGESRPQSVTVMVQKEVADRMGAEPGTKDYGALSLAIRYYTDPHIITAVSPSSFIPRPNVDSSVICLRVYGPEERPVKAADEKKMFALIRASFNQRRKTLVNGIANAGISEKSAAAKALEEMGLKENIRGECLSIEQFARLSELL